MSNITDLWLSDAFLQAVNTPKLVFGRGSTLDPTVGAYDTPPDPSSQRFTEIKVNIKWTVPQCGTILRSISWTLNSLSVAVINH